jgi:hypothetical protein
VFEQSSHLVTAMLALAGVACTSTEFDDAEEWQEVGASIKAEPRGQATLAYVIDVSESTAALAGCGGDANIDGVFNSVLDCEIAALLAVNDTARASGTIVDVGAAVFAFRGATADIQPGGTDCDLLTAPDADLDNNFMLDVTSLLRSIQVGGIDDFTGHTVGQATSYGAGLEAIEPVLSASTQPRKIVVFVSDGFNNTGPEIGSVPPMPIGTVIHTFAVGASSACEIDSSLGSLQDIADESGGTCTEVPNVADLPEIIPTVVALELAELRVTGS